MTKLVCFEGIDGSGKATQVSLIAQVLRDRGRVVWERSYPVYGSFFGKELGQLLASTRETSARDLDAKSMALWYALDRWSDYQTNADSFRTSDFVLLNRYTLSSMVYQSVRHGSTVDSSWVEMLEHEILRLPRPDLYFILDLPPEQARHNVSQKGPRDYLGDRSDVYERDASLQANARRAYLAIADRLPNARVLECYGSGVLRSPAEISLCCLEKMGEFGLL